MKEHLSLSELNDAIQTVIEEQFFDGCWVVAEIANFRIAGAGHCYMELVEKEGSQIFAKQRANCWNYVYQKVAQRFFKSTGTALSAGIKVMFYVEVKYHSVYGMSLQVLDVDPNYTLGDMARRKKEILERLEKEGLMKLNSRLDLPMVIQNIAVISSEGAAGYEDFMEHIESNNLGVKFHTQLFHATMQGENTAPDLINALKQIQEEKGKFEIVVIIRGGGSNIDLASFDNYEVAKFIAQYDLPVLTGIGHERDDCVLDFVANTRLKTPTAVADFIIDVADDFLQNLQEIKDLILNQVKERFYDEKAILTKRVNALERSANTRLKEANHALNDHVNGLPIYIERYLIGNQRSLSRAFSEVSEKVIRQLHHNEKSLISYSYILKEKVSRQLSEKKNKVEQLAQITRLNDPVRLLEKGYSLTYKNDKLVKSKDVLVKNDEIEVVLKDGKVKAKVE